MPSARSSFTIRGQNLKIPKIYFCDVITSVSIALPYVGKNGAHDQGRNFANLGGVRGCPAKFFCLSPFFLRNRSSPMVLCPVNCPEAGQRAFSYRGAGVWNHLGPVHMEWASPPEWATSLRWDVSQLSFI